MKNTLFVFLLAISFTNVCFSLTTGDIMLVAFNADRDDGIAILTLEDIPASTEIHFNDNEWNGLAVGSGGAFNSATETEMTWNSGGAIIPAGTTIVFRETDNNGNPFFGAYVGATLTGTLRGNLILAAGNEVVYCFLGTDSISPSVFLTAFANDGFNVTKGQLTNTGLTDGVNATSLAFDIDVAEYRGITTGNKAQLQLAISDPTHWITDNGGGDQSNNGGADFPPTIFTYTLILQPTKPIVTSSTCGFIGISDTAISPLLVNSASLWFKANKGTSCNTPGCSVSQWNDLSGNSNHASQAIVAKQPVYRENTTNFNSSVEFIGLLNSTILLGTGINQGVNVTIYAVALEQTQANASNGSSYRPIFSTAGIYNSVNIYGYDIALPPTNITDRISYLGPTNTSLLTSAIFYSNPYDNNYNLYHLRNESNNMEAYKNSTSVGTSTPNRTTGLSNEFCIVGNNGNNARHYRGNINEIIYFNDTISAFFDQQIQTYLAIKYGITLNIDYLNSDTTIIYDISNGFANGIFGIGKSNNFELDQPKSKSETDYSGVTIESTIDIGDENYLVIGHDSASLTRVTLAGQSNVLTRKWYAEMTGGVGTVKLELDLATIGANTSLSPSDDKIGISNSPLFTNTYWLEATNVVGGVATFDGVSLYDKYFTFSAAP